MLGPWPVGATSFKFIATSLQWAFVRRRKPPGPSYQSRCSPETAGPSPTQRDRPGAGAGPDDDMSGVRGWGNADQWTQFCKVLVRVAVFNFKDSIIREMLKFVRVPLSRIVALQTTVELDASESLVRRIVGATPSGRRADGARPLRLGAAPLASAAAEPGAAEPVSEALEQAAR